MEDIGSRLKAKLEEYRRLDKVDSHLKHLEEELDEHYARLSFIEKSLQKEYEEYEKLEKGSLRGIFYKVLGSKEDQLEKERQEYLQLSLQFDECKKSIELLEYEKGVLEKKRGDLKRVERELKALKREQEQELINSNSVHGKALLGIVQEIELLENTVADIEDALGIGREAQQLLDQMFNYLKKARNWGNWDMYSRRGGHWSAFNKHTNIDRAKEMAYKTKFVLNRFEEELQDIYEDYRPQRFDVRLEGFSKFTDIFFDNLISDWIIQQRIQNAFNNVRSVQDRVRRILDSLVVDKKKVQDELERLHEEKEDIILGSTG